jgi:hypothetical protein
MLLYSVVSVALGGQSLPENVFKIPSGARPCQRPSYSPVQIRLDAAEIQKMDLFRAVKIRRMTFCKCGGTIGDNAVFLLCLRPRPRLAVKSMSCEQRKTLAFR